MSLIRRPLPALLAAAIITIASVASVRGWTIGSHAIEQDGFVLEPLVQVPQLMENVVNHAFNSTKDGLSEKPPDRKAWKSVHAASIILGESGNLLLFRKPEEADIKDWSSFAIGLREAGADLVKATRAQDYDASKKAYRSVVNACNRCHTKFGENGEPKIEP